MQKVPYVFPIIGGRKVKHLLANIQALDISLTLEHIAYHESIIPFDPGFPSTYCAFVSPFLPCPTSGHILLRFRHVPPTRCPHTPPPRPSALQTSVRAFVDTPHTLRSANEREGLHSTPHSPPTPLRSPYECKGLHLTPHTPNTPLCSPNECEGFRRYPHPLRSANQCKAFIRTPTPPLLSK